VACIITNGGRRDSSIIETVMTDYDIGLSTQLSEPVLLRKHPMAQ
jgi:hypothetical protein